MSKYKNILRWICVLPGSILFGILVSLPVHWAVMVLMSGNPNSLISSSDGTPISIWSLITTPETLERIGVAFFAPFTIVSTSAWIAPNKKIAVTIAISVILIITISLSYFYIFNINNNFEISDSQSMMYFKWFLNFMGIAAAFAMVRKESKKSL